MPANNPFADSYPIHLYNKDGTRCLQAVWLHRRTIELRTNAATAKAVSRIDLLKSAIKRPS